MSVRSVSRLAIILAATASLAGCSILDLGRADREAQEELEKEGRITMVLGDAALEPATGWQPRQQGHWTYCGGERIGRRLAVPRRRWL